MPFFNRIAILGPGLLGASLGMAIRKREISKSIRVWARKQSSLQKCKEEVWCDEISSSVKEAVNACDLVVVCTPIKHIEETLRKIIPKCPEDTIITDVGRVKGSICKVAKESSSGKGTCFIGSHPMAGSEKSGMENATAELFENRTCMITPYPEDSIVEIEKLESFWRLLGMQVHRETPKDHDSIVSSISHLPHLIASSLADHLASCPASWLEMAGQGFKDTTRIAQGDPALWCEIMKSNRENLCDSLDQWQKSVDEVRSLLHAEKWDNLTQYLSGAADHRKKIRS